MTIQIQRILVFLLRLMGFGSGFLDPDGLFSVKKFQQAQLRGLFVPFSI
jgi:hypothetical protein